MTPERWERIGEIYGAAQALAPERRASFLERECRNDESLRREVESLLVAEEGAGDFLAGAAIEDAARMLVGKETQSLIGESLNHYEVLSQIGAGGMGEIYRARDTRLGREVAIKVLPPAFSSDRDRLNRFDREARLASTLNHPNICTIYEMGETEDKRHYIAMEYIEGDILRQQMMGREMPLHEALGIGAQVASALAAAHSAGIVHRDIKPENVIIRRDGLVKVLDFGLAKFTQEQQVAGSAVETRSLVRTSTGVVMGTPRYMSPEQARGLPVDARTDVWSLGCVLYEMVTGRTPFAGETNSDVIVSILEREPVPVTRFAPEVPAELQRIISKALRKDREERYQVMKDFALDLKSLKEEMELALKLEHSIRPEADRETDAGKEVKSAGSAGAVAPSSFGRQKIFTALALVVIVMAGGGIAFWLFERDKQRQLQVDRPAPQPKIIPLTSLAGYERQPAFSPDGNQVAFVWDGEREDNADIYVKLIGTEKPLRLTTNPASDTGPVWSRDGRYVAFLRQAAEDRGLYLVPALGGPERKLTKTDDCDLSPGPTLRIAWSPGGDFLAISDRSSPADPFSIFLLSVETGERRRLTFPPAQYFGDWNPAFSPDGKTVAFSRAQDGVYLDLYVANVSGGEPIRLASIHAYLNSLAWTPDGREIVFSSSSGGSIHTSALWKIPAAGGTPERLTGAGQNAFTLAVDRQGNQLAYEQRIYDTNVYQIDISNPADHSTPPTKLISSTFQDDSPDQSPDGKRIAFVSDRTGGKEIWVCDSDGANPLQLTDFGEPHTGTPRWSPDCRQIVFDTNVDGNQEILIISADGGQPRRLTNDPALDMIPSWSRDGRWVYFTSKRSGDMQIWKVPAEGGEARQVTRQGGLEGFESADGKFVYYSKGLDIRDIWRVPVEGGEETLVLDLQKAGHRRSWAVAEGGIYFAVAETPSLSVVKFFSFATGRVERRVAKLERSIKDGPPGLTVSRDGRRLLYTRIDQSGSDLMLMEKFR